MPTVMNAANEIVVDAFLEEQIKFTDSPRIIERVMQKHGVLKNPALEHLIESDRWAREQARSLISC